MSKIVGFCSCEVIITPKTELVNTFLKYFWKNFSDFGKYYRDEQVKRCEICLSMLEEHAEKIRDELKSKKKLNTTLIMSACIALAILLL